MSQRRELLGDEWKCALSWDDKIEKRGFLIEKVIFYEIEKKILNTSFLEKKVPIEAVTRSPLAHEKKCALVENVEAFIGGYKKEVAFLLALVDTALCITYTEVAETYFNFLPTVYVQI